MSSPVAWLVLLAQTVVSGVLLAGAALGFAFESEGRHGRALHTLANVFHGAAVVVAVLPLLLSVAWLFRRAAGGLQGGLIIGAPFLACVIGIPVFFGLMAAAESADHSARERALAEKIVALRAAGSICPLVALDAAASEAEMTTCLDQLTALPASARRGELAPFIDRGFKSHFDPTQRPVFAPALQARFVTLFFDAQFTDPRMLEDFTSRYVVFDCLRDVFLTGWTDDAKRAAAARLPELRERSKSLSDQEAVSSVASLLEEMERYAAR